MTRLPVAGWLAVAAVVASALLAPRAGAAASAELGPCVTGQVQQVTGPTGLAGSVPVLFVHGIISSPAIWRPSSPSSIAGKAAWLHGVTAWTFGYSRESLDWVTNPAIGPALAKAVSCLARASGHKVVIVAHSMGGLAAQYAVAQHDPAGGTVAHEVAELITIGTPYQGSEFLSVMQAARRGERARQPLPYWTAAQAILSACAGRTSGICALLNVMPSQVGTDLEEHSAAIRALPAWPPSLPVFDIAGDMGIRFGIGRLGPRLAVGDVAVTAGSATAHDTTGSPYVKRCNSVRLLTAVVGDPGPCFHTHLLNDGDVISRVLSAIRGAVTRQAVAPRPRGSAPGRATPSAGGAKATFRYSDSSGDTVTQEWSFGIPEPESNLPDVAQAASGCEVGTGSDSSVSANLVVPVTVTTTLNSGVSANASLALLASPMLGSGASPPVPLDEVFVYDTGQGYTCTDESDDNGTVVSFGLSQGSPDDLQAWAVLNGAISAAYPAGNPASIGVTGVSPQFNPGFSEAATVSYSGRGPAVCTSSDALRDPFLHIGGTVFGWEHCDGRVSAG